jgi:hypothetical protein
MLATALQRYGAICRIGTAANSSINFYTTPGNDTNALIAGMRSDLSKIVPLLRVMRNQSPSSVMGGGVPIPARLPQVDPDPVYYQPQFRLVGTTDWANFGRPITGLSAVITGISGNYEFDVVAYKASGSLTSTKISDTTTGGGGGGGGGAGTGATFFDDFNALTLFNDQNQSAGGTWMPAFWYSPVDMGFDSAGTWVVNPFNPATQIAGMNTVSNSTLLIKLDNTPSNFLSAVGGDTTIVGGLNSAPTFTGLFGYWEVRCSAPKQKGSELLIWILDGSGNQEIDLVAIPTFQDGTQWAKFGMWTPGPPKALNNFIFSYNLDNPIDPSVMHTYGIDVQPNICTFYLDRVQVYQFNTPPGYVNPMFWILSYGNGQDEGAGLPVTSTLPSFGLIDYVGQWPHPPFTTGGSQQESPDGTVVTAANQTITSSRTPGQAAPVNGPFDTWGMTGPGGQVIHNGVVDTTTSALIELYYGGHTVYQEATNGNSFGTPGWWSWNGTGWSDSPSPIPTLNNISLTNTSILAGQPAGTLVGDISVGMTGGTFSGTVALGGTNASRFTISSPHLVTAASLGVETDSITLTATQAGAANSPLTVPFTITSQTVVTGGTGPGASSSFVTADLTNLTGRTAPKNLFGIATGGLGNFFWQKVSQDTDLRAKIKALNLPLIRLHSGWMQIGDNQWVDTFSPSHLSGIVLNTANVFPPDIKIILGIRTNTLNYQSFFNYTKAAVAYWNANSSIKVSYVECMNEVDFTVDGGTYASCFAGMVDGAQTVDPNIKGTGPASAGNQDQSQRNAVIAQYNATTGPQKVGFFNHHQYLYCYDPNANNGAGNKPDDLTVMRAGFLPPIANGTFNDTINTWTRALPAYALFEFSLECGANPIEDRTQTSRGACFLLSFFMRAAQASTSCQTWSGAWDLFDDEGANYNLIYPNGNALGAQYYLLQRAIAKLPGQMCNITNNSQSGNLDVWATVNGTNFAVAFVNVSNNPISGPVALSHWPVNSSGNGSAKFWSYPTSDGRNVPGVETTVSVTNGVTSTVTINPRSCAILST